MSPKTITGEDLDEKQQELESLQHAYLRQRGWQYTCDNPGSYWFWTKRFGERVLTMTDKDAIRMQREMDVN